MQRKETSTKLSLFITRELDWVTFKGPFQLNDGKRSVGLRLQKLSIPMPQHSAPTWRGGRGHRPSPAPSCCSGCSSCRCRSGNPGTAACCSAGT